MTANTIPAHAPRRRPDWDEYFMAIAQLVATRSPDPATQHGCVLVDWRRRIVSTGYNGPVQGLNDDAVPRTRPEKYTYMIHAEDNAVTFAGRDLWNATAYVTGHPCAACLRRLLQAGVLRVIYGQRHSQCVTADERAACADMAAQLDRQLVEFRSADILSAPSQPRRADILSAAPAERRADILSAPSPGPVSP